jgi:hypothetical protein
MEARVNPGGDYQLRTIARKFLALYLFDVTISSKSEFHFHQSAVAMAACTTAPNI